MTTVGVEMPDNDMNDAQAAGGSATAGEDEVVRLQREIEELKDRNLRLLADQRNLQQRSLRERSEALKYAEADFARDLLVVLDDLERTEASAASGSGVQAIAEGVRIVHQNFLKILKDHGVEPIPAMGQPFDPAQHEALLQQPSADTPAGHVLSEVARGYRMHDRVIRAARVVVSSGPATE